MQKTTLATGLTIVQSQPNDTKMYLPDNYVAALAPQIATTPEMTVAVPALVVDFAAANYFYKDITSGITFSFLNMSEGRSCYLVVHNTTGGNLTIGFPTIKKRSDFTYLVKAGQYNVYTFVKVNGNIHAAVVEDQT